MIDHKATKQVLKYIKKLGIANLRKAIQSLLTDPNLWGYMRSGMFKGVREKLVTIDYQTMRNIIGRVPMVGALINLRVDQVKKFGKYVPDGDAPGYRFLYTDRTKEVTDKDAKIFNQLADFIDQTGLDYDVDREDDFADWLDMFVRETLTIDQVATEIQRNMKGEAIGFWAIDGNCYSEDTKILTETRGWVLFKDLYSSDRVATRSKEGNFERQLPTEYVARRYKGKMVHFNQRSMDILVHPDHRMLYERKRYEYDHTTFGIKPAKEIVGKLNYNAPMKSKWGGTLGKYSKVIRIGKAKVKLIDWVAFLGIYLSDGCTTGSKGNKNKYAKAVYISRPEGTVHHNEVKNLLINRLPIKFKLQSDKKNFYVTDHALWNKLHLLGNVYTKFIPNDIKNLPSKYLSILWEWALKGDGTVSFTKSGRLDNSLTTVSYRLASDYQEIIQKIGLSASITKNKMPNKMPVFKTHTVKSMKQAYIVSELHSNCRVLRGKYVDYNGMILCVTVPNEILYVSRNGYAAWCGNTIKRV